MTKRKQNVLVLDVGGTNVKVIDSRHTEPVKIPSGPAMSASLMVAEVKKATEGWSPTAVSIGYPGIVFRGKPVTEPHNLAPGWVDFDFETAFGCPVRIVNDAAMQALGSYEGGRMLFLGFGTGLGSAMIVEGILAPMELAHLPYRKGRTFEDYVGQRGLLRLGKNKWRRHVEAVIAELRTALEAEYVVLGGGNTKFLDLKALNSETPERENSDGLPQGVRLGGNSNAFLGGFRLWESATWKASADGEPEALAPGAVAKAKRAARKAR
ncbi:MAG: ROK family protein [Acidobacteriota bacterium]